MELREICTFDTLLQRVEDFAFLHRIFFADGDVFFQRQGEKSAAASVTRKEPLLLEDVVYKSQNTKISSID
jgi:hypothetical protein